MTPVVGLAEKMPLKLVSVETVMLVMFAGAAEGVIVVLPLKLTDVSG